MRFDFSDRDDIVGRCLWLLPIATFMMLVVAQIQLPGIYMDAINPDFLAAQLLDHRLHNPGAALPSSTFPLLGNLYHGVQNVYVGLPLFALFGCSVATLRLAQAVFGVILLSAVYLTARRLTRSNGLALACGLGLATELAFTASFRTQFYIVLGGAAWLFVSLLLALPADKRSLVLRHRTFLSGVFAGLAGYGYFVLLFFVPGMLMLVALRSRNGWRDLPIWIIGLAAGMLPFALGYLSLVLKLHGVEPALAFIRSLLSQLHPFDANGASGGHLGYAWQLIRLAVTDSGNEAMIFGQPLPSTWGVIKFYLFAGVTLSLTALCVLRLFRRDEHLLQTLPALLPVSFVSVALLFGQRLWVHHFSVLVPFLYLLATLLVAEIGRWAGLSLRMKNAVTGLVIVGCLAGNLVQQADFHERLAKTGGGAKSPEALTTLAVEARGAPKDVAYIFPEWGFFTSFSFLTGNRVRYVTDSQPETFDKLRKAGYRHFRLVYWDIANREHYRQTLLSAGASSITERTFTTREGMPTFYWLDAE